MRKIILINSIQAYVEIELDTAIHFQGEAGSGKTDYLQLISSFYTGSLKNPHSPEKGISYYLPHSNSWIIYEVAGAKGLFSVAFHREEAVPKAYFLNGDYEKECFFKKDKALGWKEVQAILKKRKLHQAGPFDLEGSYWQILSGSYQAKDKSDLRRYTIMNSSNADFIPRVLRSLWIEGQISFELLKEISCSLEEVQDARIDLEEIDKASKSLRKDIRSIKSWQGAEVDIQELLKEEKSLELLTEKAEKIFQELPWAIDLHKNEKQALKSKYEKAQQSWEDVQTHADESRRERLDALKTFYLKKGELNYKLSLAKEKDLYYQKQDIQQKLHQFYELNLRKQQADLLRDMGQEAKADPQKTKTWWEASLKKEKALAELSEKALSQKESLLKKWASARTDLESEKKSLKSLEEKSENLAKAMRELETERVKLLGENLDFSSGKYRRQIQKAQEESIELKLQIRLSEEQSSALQKRKEKEFEDLEKEAKAIEKKSLNLLKDKRNVHKKLESQIANSGRAFMGWLEKNYPDWQQSVGKLLKEEVLLSPFLSPGIERINELFYGIHLELSELPESSLSLEQLQKDKELLEKEIAQLEKELAQRQQTYTKQLDTREKYYRQKSRELKRQLQKDEYALQQLELSIKKNEAEIDKGNLRRDQRKEAALIKLSYREADLVEAIKEAEKSHLQALKKWEEQKEKLDKAEEKAFKKWGSDTEKEKANILTAWQTFQDTNPKTSDISHLGPDIFIWEKLQKELQAYESDKSQFIDQLEAWEVEADNLDIQIANRESIEKLSEGERKRRRELLQEEWKDAQQAWKQWQSLDEKLSIWLKDNPKNIDKLKGVEEGDIEPLEKLLTQLKEIQKEKNLRELLLRKKLRQALSCFSNDNAFELEVYLEDEAAEKRQLTQLKKLALEGKSEEIIQGIHQRQSEFLASVNELFSRLQPDLAKLEARLDKLTNSLQEQFSKYLETESQFAISHSRKGIFRSLTNLRNFYLENRDQLGGSSLFNQGDKVELNRQAFELLEEVDRQLQALPDKVLSPFQILELEWEVEGEKRLKNFGQLSPKSKRAIHSYLASYLFQEIMAGEKELSLHFFLDDIHELDPTFLQYLQEQLKQSHIKLCSASNHTSEYISSEKQLQLSVSEQGETLIMPAEA
ncbi:MAG: ATP-binding protein [Bacteroidia bacterium]|nr:ATP-binding protein [Bacteroidia bacterium]